MPSAKRTVRAYTEEWARIRQWCLWPEQRLYELIRPVVLFGTTTRDRAIQTEAAEKTIRRTADTFEEEGVMSLFRPSRAQRADHHRSLPVPMRQLMSIRRFADLEVDLARRQVRLRGVDVHLPPTEFALLKLLIGNAGKVLTHRMILQHVWGQEYSGENEYLRVYINRLRDASWNLIPPTLAIS